MLKRYSYMEGFTNITGSDGKYLISCEGSVKRSSGAEVEQFTTPDGHIAIRCKAWDGERDYRIIDLIAIQFKCLKIDVVDYNSVVAFHIDGDFQNLKADNVGYRFSNGKLECKKAPGYYYIPGFTSIAINEFGKTINSVTAKPVKQQRIGGSDRDSGYKRVVATFETGKQVTVLLHRALCLVFKPYPNNVDSITVNHKNGIPGDDRLDNLEWATYSENSFHAHETGLIKLSTPVLVKDIFKETITEYYSIAECARNLKVNTSAIFNRIQKSEFGKMFSDGTQIKLKSDKRPWVVISNPEKEFIKNQKEYSVESRNHFTGETRIFKSIAEAGRFINCCYLRDFFSRERQPLFKSGWQFKKLTDNWNEIDDVEKAIYCLQNEVMSRNEVTGDVVVARSSERMAELLNLNPISVRNAALTRGNKVYRGYRFRLGVSTDPWPSTISTGDIP